MENHEDKQPTTVESENQASKSGHDWFYIGVWVFMLGILGYSIYGAFFSKNQVINITAVISAWFFIVFIVLLISGGGSTDGDDSGGRNNNDFI